MNWQHFLIGNGCFALAYLLRLWNRWAMKIDWNPLAVNVINWIWAGALILTGVGFIIASLPSHI